MIRPRREADTAGLAELVREVAPGWVVSEAGIRHRLAAAPARARRSDWIAEVAGEVAGWGSSALETDVARDDVASARVMVRPDRRGRGLGTALYEAAEEHARSIGARRLLAGSNDDPASRAFAARRGFRHTRTERLSSLDPRSVDAHELGRIAAEQAAQGFSLAPFAAFADRPELIYTVDAEASLDEPNDEQVTDLRLDDWIDRHWRHPDLSHDGSFAVVHEERPVAIAELLVDIAGARAANGFTATLRAYRGRGLARLAKLASIAWLRDHGVTRVVTQNDETNAPMLAVNRRLGYTPFASEHAFVKDFE